MQVFLMILVPHRAHLEGFFNVWEKSVLETKHYVVWCCGFRVISWWTHWLQGLFSYFISSSSANTGEKGREEKSTMNAFFIYWCIGTEAEVLSLHLFAHTCRHISLLTHTQRSLLSFPASCAGLPAAAFLSSCTISLLVCLSRFLDKSFT